MAGQITIYDSFSRRLPDLGLGPGKNESASAFKHGSTSDLTNPPKFWIEHDARYWSTYAEQYLRTKQHELRLCYLPAIERPFEMDNEADVTRASTLWLAHSVNLALTELFDSQIVFKAEYSSDGTDLRVDFIWRLRDNHDGTEPKHVAALELKRRGVIKINEWAAATTKNDPRAIGQKQKQTRRDTALSGSAKKLSKQAAAYAIRYGTRFVALFDWNYMFLYYFGGLSREQKGPNAIGGTVGAEAYGTLISDETANTCRRVLLGWLIAACAEKGLVPGGGGGGGGGGGVANPTLYWRTAGLNNVDKTVGPEGWKLTAPARDGPSNSAQMAQTGSGASQAPRPTNISTSGRTTGPSPQQHGSYGSQQQQPQYGGGQQGVSRTGYQYNQGYGASNLGADFTSNRGPNQYGPANQPGQNRNGQSYRVEAPQQPYRPENAPGQAQFYEPSYTSRSLHNQSSQGQRYPGPAFQEQSNPGRQDPGVPRREMQRINSGQPSNPYPGGFEERNTSFANLQHRPTRGQSGGSSSSTNDTHPPEEKKRKKRFWQ